MNTCKFWNRASSILCWQNLAGEIKLLSVLKNTNFPLLLYRCYLNGTFLELTKQWRLWWQRPCMNSNPFLTNSSESYHGWTKRMLLIGSAVHQMHPSTYILRLVETRGNILTGDRVSLSGHRTRWKENLIKLWFSSLYQWHTEQNNNYLWIIKREYLKEIMNEVALKPFTSGRDLNPWGQNSNTARA